MYKIAYLLKYTGLIFLHLLIILKSIARVSNLRPKVGCPSPSKIIWPIVLKNFINLYNKRYKQLPVQLLLWVFTGSLGSQFSDCFTNFLNMGSTKLPHPVPVRLRINSEPEEEEIAIAVECPVVPKGNLAIVFPVFSLDCVFISPNTAAKFAKREVKFGHHILDTEWYVM